MSLRCSLLGHEFGESEIERDREERGNEVVISVVELERCTRCEKTRTISENTEVTQLSRTDAESEDEELPDVSGEPADSQPSGIRPRPEAAPDSQAAADPEPAPGALESDPSIEDTEIIEDNGGFEDDADVESDEGDREPGSWPEIEDHEERVDESRSAWPSVEGEDEGFDAATPDGPTDVEFGGLTPQADQGAEIIESGGAQRESAGDEPDEPAFVSSESIRAISGETVLFCPNCAVSGLDERDSLRAGDICPACHRGYLAEREA